MQIGEYWSATSDELDDTLDKTTIWLFLIAAQATYKRKRCFLGIKCSWDTRAPIMDDATAQAHWFFEDGNCIEDDLDFILNVRERGNGRRFLKPNA